MNADRLLAHYEQVVDAPDAIARLRRFILDLAVRGKLVPQDPSNPSAAGYRKPTDPTAPFELPGNWRWIGIGEQLELLNGMAFKPTDWSSKGLRIVRIQNLNNPAAPFNYCDPQMTRARALIDKGSFLISWSGTPGTSFGAFIWSRGPAVLNQHIFRCDFKTKLFSPAFLRLAINGRLDEMIAKAHGGVGLQHITKGKLEALLIPLPPLAEQNRIVAKVDELMGLCDRLEAARADREAARDRLAAASLARLNTPETVVQTAAASPEPEVSRAFADHARFILDALPVFTARPGQVKALRQTILNLAVRGKLVPQNTNDEPASELVKRIAEEIAAYGNANQVGRAKIDPIMDSDLPFAAPTGWEWTRLSSLFNVITDGDHQPPPKADKGVAFLTIGNVTTGKIDFTNCRLVSKSYFDSIATYRTPAKGDLLYTVVGATYGRPALVETDRAFCVQRHIAILKPVHLMSLRYLNTLLTSPLIYDQATRSTTGTAQPTIGLRPLRNFLAPLPPLAEQHRIVAKVDALMALCDKLEASLTAAADTRRRLLDALLAEAVAPEENRLLEAAE